MDLSFGNPLGAWALLGVPAILAIHFLQRQARRVVTSTLFLLEQAGPVSAQGRRLERVRNSLPLWLQLLAVLLVTWLLVQPRWLRADSAQTIVLVLDSSVSMRAFREPLLAALSPRIVGLRAAAARTEWILLESDPARPTLYSGPDAKELLAAVAAWQPRLGSHDPEPALRVARALVRENGAVVFVTDRSTPVPEGIDLFAVGSAFGNVGFTGLSVDEGQWTALVRNAGDAPEMRTWWLETPDGIKSTAAEITLAAGETRLLKGRLPDGDGRVELRLSPDQFALDDRLPIVTPAPKRLSVAVQPGTPFSEFFDRLVASLPNVEPAGAETAAVRLASYDPLAPASVTAGSIVLASDPAPSPKYRTGDVFADKHPLTTDLSWQGLIVRETLGLPRREGDEVLVWQGDYPLIFLRSTDGGLALVVNFDLRQSNADRLPAFVVLLNRFVERIRAGVVAPETLNVETNQLLNVATRAGGGKPIVAGENESSPKTSLRAPAEPGFFEVTQDGAVLLKGAAFFADAREGDFRMAGSSDTLAGRRRELVARNSQQDLLTPVWALALLGVCLGSWAAVARKGPRT